jgi:hypothetical protein
MYTPSTVSAEAEAESNEKAVKDLVNILFVASERLGFSLKEDVQRKKKSRQTGFYL